MRDKDILGWTSLLTGYFVFYLLEYYTAGLVMFSMALMFFLASIVEQVLERKMKKQKVRSKSEQKSSKRTDR